MDLFEKYFKELVTGEAKTPWHSQMARLNAAATMLRYPEQRNRTLRFLAKMLWQMGHAGEAYQAAHALPPEELSDATGIIKAVEVDEVLAQNMSFNLELITLCNLRCPMCSHGSKTQGNNRTYLHKAKAMPLADFKRIWNKIRRRTGFLVFVGQGETFMHPNIYEILDIVAPTPIHIDTNANISLDADKLVRSSLKSLIFSVDGVDQRTYELYRVGGSFQKVLDNINAVVQAKKKLGRGPELVFKYVVFKHNEAYLDEAEKLARRLEVDRIQVVPCLCGPTHDRQLIGRLMPHGRHRALSRIKRIDYGRGAVDMAEGHGSAHCLAPMGNPNIQIDGTLTPCCAITEGVGNLLENDFTEIWKSEAYREFRLGALLNRFQLENCRECSRAQNNLGHLFDGTDLSCPPPPPQTTSYRLTIYGLRPTT